MAANKPKNEAVGVGQEITIVEIKVSDAKPNTISTSNPPFEKIKGHLSDKPLHRPRRIRLDDPGSHAPQQPAGRPDGEPTPDTGQPGETPTGPIRGFPMPTEPPAEPSSQ